MSRGETFEAVSIHKWFWGGCCVLQRYISQTISWSRLFFVLCVWAFSLAFVSCADREAQALQLYEKGQCAESCGELAAALEAYLKAADYLSDSSNRLLYAKVSNQLSTLFFEHGFYSRAMDASKRVVADSSFFSDKTELSRAYRGMGKIYYINGDSQQALQYLLLAKQLEPQIEDAEEIASIYNNLSNVYCEIGAYEKALACNTQAISWSDRAIPFMRDSLRIDRNRAVRGRIYTHLCRYDSALYYILLASQSSDARVCASSYYKLSDLPVEAGITDSMKYVYLSRAEVLSDSIEHSNHANLVIEGEHQHQINTLKSREVARWSLLVGAVIVLMLALAFFFYFRFRRKTVKYEQLIAELTDGHREQNELNERSNVERERMLVSIINNAGDTCAANFRTQQIYAELLDLLKQDRMLNYEEQDRLLVEVNAIFEPYLKQLVVVVDRLSTNDLFLCCLFLLKFTTKECAFCRGVSNETIRSQRTRIKKKIPSNLLDAGLMKGCFGND